MVSDSKWGYNTDKITQPTCVIYDETTFIAICSQQCIEKLTNKPEVHALSGIAHVDFYDKPEAVKIAAETAAAFFHQ